MFQLTNEQRTHFGLQPVLEGWQAVRPKPSPHDKFETVCHVSGNREKLAQVRAQVEAYMEKNGR